MIAIVSEVKKVRQMGEVCEMKILVPGNRWRAGKGKEGGTQSCKLE
jgi:orotidine-5'-phosphate decarboxylase